MMQSPRDALVRRTAVVSSALGELAQRVVNKACAAVALRRVTGCRMTSRGGWFRGVDSEARRG